jgi:hypothetical protein
MENIVSQEEAAPPVPDVKFGDRVISVFLLNMGKFFGHETVTCWIVSDEEPQMRYVSVTTLGSSIT